MRALPGTPVGGLFPPRLPPAIGEGQPRMAEHSVDAFVGRFVGAFAGVLQGLKTLVKSTLVGPVVGALVGPLVGRGSLSPALCVAQRGELQSHTKREGLWRRVYRTRML